MQFMFVFLTAAPRCFFLSVCDFKFHSGCCIIHAVVRCLLLFRTKMTYCARFSLAFRLSGTETLANRHFSTARSPFVQIQSETTTKNKKVFRLSLLSSPSAQTHARLSCKRPVDTVSGCTHFRGLLIASASRLEK